MPTDIIKAINIMENKNSDILFKPVQLRIIKKMAVGRPLSENEKRYLRGNLGKKLSSLQVLIRMPLSKEDDLSVILRNLQEYYITGYEALKHNGYGWYFDTKRTVVVNTRIDGTLKVNEHIIVFRRVKSLGKKAWTVDAENGLRYASNERIYHDARSAHEVDIVGIWVDLLERYGKMFVPRPERFKHLLTKRVRIERPEDYNV